jgi:hypothetical protein
MDEGVDLKNRPDLILTKSYMHACNNKVFKNLAAAPVLNTKACFFDGKKYATLVHEVYGESSHRNIIEG